jgi:hypothetical protein
MAGRMDRSLRSANAASITLGSFIDTARHVTGVLWLPRSQYKEKAISKSGKPDVSARD